MPFLRGIFLSVMLAMSAMPAFACNGPTVFPVNFLAADPAWTPGILPPDLTPTIPVLVIFGGQASVTPPVGNFVLLSYNGNFFDNNDVCVDVTGPTVADTTQATAGISFGQTDASFYVFAIQEDGQAGILSYDLTTLIWSYLVPMAPASALKGGTNVTNTLRVTWNGAKGTATAYINGQQFATFAIANLKNSMFGVWCEGDPGVNPTTGATWQFANLKITDIAP